MRRANRSRRPRAASKTPRLSFPVTTLDGKPSASKQQPPPPEEQIEEAVKQQQDLLAEFEKIADELNRVLASLEGSTLLKRLKAASRHAAQDRRADRRSGVGGLRS